MPIYEYRCHNGHEFEALQRMSAEPLSSCESCGAPAQRVLSAPAVHFKGSGFYATDYAKKEPKESSTASDTGTSSDTASSDTASSDTKTKKPDSPSSSNGASASSD